MNITILGAGAVGGYIGGRLMEAGMPVSFLVRQRRAGQLRENGLAIHSVHGDYKADSIRLYTDAGEIPDSDVVILAVKGYHVENTLSQLRTLVNKGAKVLPFLNGMTHFRLLEKEFGEANVIRGLASIIATLDDDGHVVQTSGMHDFIFGAAHPSQVDFCKRLEEVFAPANLNSSNSSRILFALWQKYAFITAFSGVTTASRLPVGKILDTPETLELFQDVLQEMKELAAAYGVDLGEGIIDAVTQQIRDLPEDATSSMHQDFRKGQPIEVEALHGVALRMAKEKDLALPDIQTLYALLKPYEFGVQND